MEGFFVMVSTSKPSLSVSSSVGTLRNEYLTVLSSLLDRSTGIFASIFLNSRNYKDGAQADMQYIFNLWALVLVLLSAWLSALE